MANKVNKIFVDSTGKGYAVKKGILKAKNSWILICDIDLSVHPNQFKIWYNKNLLK